MNERLHSRSFVKTSGKVKVVLSNAMGKDGNWSVAGFAALLVDGMLRYAVEHHLGLTALLAKDMVKRLPCAEVYPGLSPRLMLMILLMIVLMLMMMIVLLLMIVMMLAHVTAFWATLHQQVSQRIHKENF